MAKQFARIEAEHHDFILRQRVFFTASAAPDGRVNVSPREAGSLRLIGPNCVAYLDLTGSGCERPSLQNWAQAKGEAGLEAYRREKNSFSIDGLSTGLCEAEASDETVEPLHAPEVA